MQCFKVIIRKKKVKITKLNSSISKRKTQKNNSIQKEKQFPKTLHSSGHYKLYVNKQINGMQGIDKYMHHFIPHKLYTFQ